MKIISLKKLLKRTLQSSYNREITWPIVEKKRNPHHCSTPWSVWQCLPVHTSQAAGNHSPHNASQYSFPASSRFEPTTLSTEPGFCILPLLRAHAQARKPFRWYLGQASSTSGTAVRSMRGLRTNAWVFARSNFGALRRHHLRATNLDSTREWSSHGQWSLPLVPASWFRSARYFYGFLSVLVNFKIISLRN